MQAPSNAEMPSCLCALSRKSKIVNDGEDMEIHRNKQSMAESALISSRPRPLFLSFLVTVPSVTLLKGEFTK